MNNAGLGNVDGDEQSVFPSEAVMELADCRIAIRHILCAGGKLTKDGRAFLQAEQPDLCVFGHTHQPKVEWFGKTVLFNPGTAGPKQFSLLRGVGVLRFEKGQVVPSFIVLGRCLSLNNRKSTITRFSNKEGAR